MTNLVFATEAVFEVDQHGRGWGMAGFGDTLWNELLENFDTVTVVARVRHVEMPDLTIPITNPKIALHPLPFYRGPWLFLRTLPAFLVRLRSASRLNGAFLLRLPGPVGTFLAEFLRRAERRYAVQLVGDPHDVLGSGGLGRIAGWLRKPVVVATRRAVREAAVTSYVTSSALQRRYPSAPSTPTFGVSDIKLTPEWFGQVRDAPTGRPYRLFLCGSLAQRYKGVDLMLDAMALIRENGLSVTAVVAGDGHYRTELEEQAHRLNLTNHVDFVGAVSPASIRDHLDHADIFLMPSRTEGMPRALIEAMARGLPAIGSNVGGIVELLDDAQRFDREDVKGLASATMRLIGDAAEYRRQSTRNLSLARTFAASELEPRRAAFYRAVRNAGIMTQ